jgi:hypothetical protein
MPSMNATDRLTPLDAAEVTGRGRVSDPGPPSPSGACQTLV